MIIGSNVGPSANPIAVTWANRPTASAVPGATIYVTDVGVGGGSYWYSDGAAWRPHGIVRLALRTVQDTSAVSTDEKVLEQVTIPAGLIQTGAVISVQFSLTKSVTAAATTTRIRLGEDMTTLVGGLLTASYALYSQTRPGIGDTALLSMVEFVKISATTVRVLNTSILSPNGVSTTASYGGTLTLLNTDNMDTTTQYLALTTTNASSEVHTNQFFEVSIR